MLLILFEAFFAAISYILFLNLNFSSKVTLGILGYYYEASIAAH